MFTTAVICILLVYFYFYYTWNKNYWKNRNVPYDEPVFILGSLKDVLFGSKHFGIVYRDIYRKFKNVPYVGYFKLRDPGLLIRDPELIKDVLVKDFAHFANNDFEVNKTVDPILAENIFAQTGEEWRKNRSAWSAGLTMNKIKATHEMMGSKCDQMIEYLKRHIQNNSYEPLEARELSSSLFTDVVVSGIFGLEINSFSARTNRYRKIVNSFFLPSFWEGLKLLSFMFTPGLARLLKLRFVSKSIQDELVVIANEIVENRQMSNYQKNNSFDSILCNEKKYEKVSKYAIAGLVFNFLIDGTETSSGVCAFVLYALAANPHVQAKLREELSDAPKDENGNISYEVINKLPYMDMVVSETIRLYPPALSIHRVCTKAYTFPAVHPGGSPLEIEPGTTMTIPVYALHMDPEYFPDPEKFDPERFSEENKANFPKFAYLPFGEGPRICVGSRFGLNQVKVEVAGILSNFEIRLAPQMRNKNIEVDPNILIFRNKDGLWITFHNLPK